MKYPEEHEGVVKTWTKGDYVFTLLKGAGFGNHYCGYIRLPTNPFKATTRTYDWGSIEYTGIIEYIPAHGGITYGKSDQDGSIVFGFDCAHYMDADNPQLQDIDWLTAHCEDIAHWLKIAESFEDRFIASENNEQERAQVVNELIDEAFKVPFDPHNNLFLTMKLMLGGGGE